MELAGYTGAGGKLTKPIPGNKISVPSAIWIEGQMLKWSFLPVSKGRPSRAPRTELLNDFVKLWDSPDAKILAFAEQNGVLRMEERCFEGSEPLKQWRGLSRAALAMLNIGAELVQEKKRIDSEEFKHFMDIDEDGLHSCEKPEAAGLLLELAVQNWLKGGIGFSINRTGRSFALEIDYHGRMLEAVILQLALTLSRADSLYFCSGCGLPYNRPTTLRKPKPGQDNFCARDGCGNAAALRHADARRKAKMADAQRLHDEGVPLSEIAKRLDTTPASIRRWVKKGKVK